MPSTQHPHDPNDQVRVRVDFEQRYVVIDGPDEAADALAGALSDMMRGLMRAVVQRNALAARDIVWCIVGALDTVDVQLVGRPDEIEAWAHAGAPA